MYLNNLDNLGSGNPTRYFFSDEEKGNGKKKSDSSDSFQNDSWVNGFGTSKPATINPELEHALRTDVAGVKSRLGSYGFTPRSDDEVRKDFKDTFYNVMTPKATPERRMMLYSQSERALDDVLGGDYMDDLKERYRMNREVSKEQGRDSSQDALSVVGGDPLLAQREAMKADNPIKDIEKTISESNASDIANRVEPLVRHSGYDMGDYLNDKVVPKMYKELYDEALENEKPKSRSEYILRSALDNSLVGKVSMAGQNLLNNNRDHNDLQREGLYGYNAKRVDNFASTVGSLLVDSPVFSLLGRGAGAIVGKATSHFTNKLANRIVVSGFADKVEFDEALKMAKKIITRKLSSHIARNASLQGVTLGGYDVAHSIADDILAGEGIGVGKAAGAFGKGLLTGAAAGAAGTPFRVMANNSQGIKRAFASSGVLCAESAAFTASSEAEKAMNGVEIAPIDIIQDFGESTATLLTMRLANWRPKGASLKLGENGKIKEEFRLTESERMELQEQNTDADQLMKYIEDVLKMPSFNDGRYGYLLNTYTRLMSNGALSASAKAKLLFLVENKISSTPPVPFDYSVREKRPGRLELMIFDPLGRKINTFYYKTPGNVRNAAMLQRGEIRANRIQIFENELTNGLKSVNFLQQAGNYAREKGIDPDVLSEAMYKKSLREPLSANEETMISELLQRSAYDDSGMVKLLYDTRRSIEEKYGLKKGQLLTKVDEQFFRLMPNENEALDEYERFLRREVDALKEGTDAGRVERIRLQGQESEFGNRSNSNVRYNEVADYNEELARYYDQFNKDKPTPSKSNGLSPDRERYDGYVKSGNGAKNTVDDIARYKERATELGERLGVEMNFINDLDEIPVPDVQDEVAVNNYKYQRMSPAWANLGKVYINLPNTLSMQELEKSVLHEAVTHKGLLQVFGLQLMNFMEDVLRKASPEVVEGIRKIGYKYKGFNKYTIVEEYLAHLAENISLTPKERTLYVRVKDYIKNLLIRMRLYTGNNRYVSESDLTDLMQRHYEYMLKKVPKDKHRREVFGDFSTAHKKGYDIYYDRPTFFKEAEGLIKKGVLLPEAPRYLRHTKGLIFGELMPEEERIKMGIRYNLEN